MNIQIQISILIFAATTILAFPPPTNPRARQTTTTPPTLTAQSLLDIAPETSTCASASASAPFPSECATADTAAPNIAVSFANFGITTFGAQAALVALMLYESGSFRYSRNHYPAPGRPGQGTRNMQSAAYNGMYAAWLAGRCANCGISAGVVEAATAQGPDAVLELVNGDQWGFGSAAWFLATQCDAGIQQGLASGSAEGWRAYVEDCVGTTLTDERTAVWQKAMALGHW